MGLSQPAPWVLNLGRFGIRFVGFCSAGDFCVDVDHGWVFCLGPASPPFDEFGGENVAVAGLVVFENFNHGGVLFSADAPSPFTVDYGFEPWH